jgi:hypothetical protein
MILSRCFQIDRFSVDTTVLRIDDIYQRETHNRIVLQNLDWRLQRLEDLNMNMYDMIKRMHYNQSSDEQDLPNILHRRSSCFDDDISDRRRHRRRRSSLSGYELNYVKDKPLPKSTTMMDQLFNSRPRSSMMLDQVLFSKKSNQPQRQATIRRLNSSTSNDSNITRIQSNEYTSITDGFTLSFLFLI